ncbi:hypothetical protein F4805DRAFT_472884, partial [Annulohypoxylon moriforme]
PNRIPQKALVSCLEWWWWWEIGASLLSIIGIILILVFLGRTDGMALADWSGPIQPNTVVSILTTVVRSSLMIPIASCLGQYKWRHFRTPEKLQSLQVLDEASRGPWGSLLLVSNSRLRQATTALFFSIATILALGIEPSAQQILSFPIREALLSNVTAYIGEAEGYEVSYIHDSQISYQKNKDQALIEATLLRVILGSPPQTDFYCPEPATRCSWDDFTTLAVCVDNSINITPEIACWNCTTTSRPDDTSPDCTKQQSPDNSTQIPVWVQFCKYNFHLNSSPCDDNANDFGYSSVGHSEAVVMNSLSTTGLVYKLWHSCDGSGSLISSLALVRTDPFGDWKNWESLQSDLLGHSEMSISKWKWCEKTFHNITATPRGVDFTSVTEESLQVLKEDLSTLQSHHVSRSTGRRYSTHAWDSHLTSILEDSDTFKLLFYKSFSMTNFTKTVADIMNNLMTDNTTQINTRLRMRPGNAYYDEVYIQVRWYWTILPVIETVMTSILLGICILLNRNEPLFKNSVLAYLSCGLEGWEKGAMDIGPPESVAKLEEVLGSQTARLSRGEDGLLKLRKSKV